MLTYTHTYTKHTYRHAHTCLGQLIFNGGNSWCIKNNSVRVHDQTCICSYISKRSNSYIHKFNMLYSVVKHMVLYSIETIQCKLEIQLSAFKLIKQTASHVKEAVIPSTHTLSS